MLSLPNSAARPFVAYDLLDVDRVAHQSTYVCDRSFASIVPVQDVSSSLPGHGILTRQLTRQDLVSAA